MAKASLPTSTRTSKGCLLPHSSDVFVPATVSSCYVEFASPFQPGLTPVQNPVARPHRRNWYNYVPSRVRPRVDSQQIGFSNAALMSNHRAPSTETVDLLVVAPLHGHCVFQSLKRESSLTSLFRRVRSRNTQGWLFSIKTTFAQVCTTLKLSCRELFVQVLSSGSFTLSARRGARVRRR